jgi:hypothetical protein
MAILKIARKIALTVCAYLIFCVAAGIAIAEFALHPVRRVFNSASRDEGAAHASDDDAALSEISIAAKDGITLHAWVFRPEEWNGNSVIVLHGLKDNRIGMLDYADIFLAHGYSVLTPDSRAHGESGGTVASYGFLETDDIHRWLDWMMANRIRLVFMVSVNRWAQHNFCRHSRLLRNFVRLRRSVLFHLIERRHMTGWDSHFI